MPFWYELSVPKSDFIFDYMGFQSSFSSVQMKIIIAMPLWESKQQKLEAENIVHC